MQQELRDRLEIEKQKVETLRLKLPKSEIKKETENEDNEETLNTILDELLKENARLEVFMTRLNSEKFQNFQFQPKLSFLSENHKNDNQNEFPDFYEFTLSMIL